jgi:hypothetical protein
LNKKINKGKLKEKELKNDFDLINKEYQSLFGLIFSRNSLYFDSIGLK